jgi:hypothetical protein
MRNPNLINNSTKLLIMLPLVDFFVQQNISSDILSNCEEIKTDIKFSSLSSYDRNKFMSSTKKTISSSTITCMINNEFNCKRTSDR